MGVKSMSLFFCLEFLTFEFSQISNISFFDCNENTVYCFLVCMYFIFPVSGYLNVCILQSRVHTMFTPPPLKEEEEKNKQKCASLKFNKPRMSAAAMCDLILLNTYKLAKKSFSLAELTASVFRCFQKLPYTV